MRVVFVAVFLVMMAETRWSDGLNFFRLIFFNWIQIIYV